MNPLPASGIQSFICDMLVSHSHAKHPANVQFMPDSQVITSSQNPFFRHCLQLRKNRQRRKAGQFLIDGEVEIVRAVQSGLQVQHLLVNCQHALSPGLRQLLADYPEITLETFSPQLIGRLEYGQVVGAVIAVAQAPSLELDTIQITSDGLVLVLDQIEKPGNLGACMRTAAACGVQAVVLTDPVCDPFNANAIRASRGTMFGTQLAVTTASEFLSLAMRIRLSVFAARVQSEKSLWQLPLHQGAAIVFGSEAWGLDQRWRSDMVQDFTIPMNSKADSLNVSISAAVSLYEAVRQRLNVPI